MSKCFVLLALAALPALAQNSPDVLTNEAVIRMVQAGVPTSAITKAIEAAENVDFRFIGPELQRLTDSRVPDAVFKAMYVRDRKGSSLSLKPPQAIPAVELGRSNGTGARKAEPGLTNESIVKLVKAGMTEDVVLGMVNTQPSQYSLTTEDLIALKQAGVGQKVIAAMISRVAALGGTAGPASSASNLDVPSAGLVNEVGIYIKRGNSWDEVVPEPINWKTGGVVKHVATVGVVKGDKNGSLAGPGSRNVIALPAEFLIYTREAESYGEYLLLRLHQNNDSREFRVITGGIFHQKGGDLPPLFLPVITRETRV